MPHKLDVLIPAFLLVLAACAHRHGPAGPHAENPAQVEVTNNYSLPMEIHVYGAGSSYRLGIVHPGMTGHFTVPQTLVGGGSVQFRAHPTARGPVAGSGDVVLSRGALVRFVIAAQPFNSTVTVIP